MNKDKEKSFFSSGYSILIYIILAILLLTMTFKSQIIILSYGEDYSMRLEYTVYGYCIRASAALKATEPAVYNEVYIGNSFKSSILKAVEQMEKLDGDEQTVRIMSHGFPKNNQKLELEIKQYLEETGRKVEIISNIDLTTKKT